MLNKEKNTFYTMLQKAKEEIEFLFENNEEQKMGMLTKLEEIKIPKIVVIGGESSGKSTLLDALIGYNLFPKGKG
jgi:ABC-type uncharacterized transport system ATPase component